MNCHGLSHIHQTLTILAMSDNPQRKQIMLGLLPGQYTCWGQPHGWEFRKDDLMLNSLTLLIFLDTYANGRQSRAHENNTGAGFCPILAPYRYQLTPWDTNAGSASYSYLLSPGDKKYSSMRKKNMSEFRICLGVVLINISFFFFFFKWCSIRCSVVFNVFSIWLPKLALLIYFPILRNF